MANASTTRTPCAGGWERVVGFRGEQYHAEFIEQELLGSAPAEAGKGT